MLEVKVLWFSILEDLSLIKNPTSKNKTICIEQTLTHITSETFECHDANAGYYVSRTAVTHLSVEPVGDLLERLVQTNIELRITPSLWKLREEIINSSVSFSIIRMRNASI